VWFVWSDERVNHSNSYSRPTTKFNSHNASFLGVSVVAYPNSGIVT